MNKLEEIEHTEVDKRATQIRGQEEDGGIQSAETICAAILLLEKYTF